LLMYLTCLPSENPPIGEYYSENVQNFLLSVVVNSKISIVYDRYSLNLIRQ
jgi:hypothetical protein